MPTDGNETRGFVIRITPAVTAWKGTWCRDHSCIETTKERDDKVEAVWKDNHGDVAGLYDLKQLMGELPCGTVELRVGDIGTMIRFAFCGAVAEVG